MTYTANQQACLDFMQQMARGFSEDDELLQEYDDAIGTLKVIFFLGFDPDRADLITSFIDGASNDEWDAAFQLQAMLRLSISFDVDEEDEFIYINYVEGYDQEQAYAGNFAGTEEAMCFAISYGAERWLEQKLFTLAHSFDGALKWDGDKVWKGIY